MDPSSPRPPPPHSIGPPTPTVPGSTAFSLTFHSNKKRQPLICPAVLRKEGSSLAKANAASTVGGPPARRRGSNSTPNRHSQSSACAPYRPPRALPQDAVLDDDDDVHPPPQRERRRGQRRQGSLTHSSAESSTILPPLTTSGLRTPTLIPHSATSSLSPGAGSGRGGGGSSVSPSSSTSLSSPTAPRGYILPRSEWVPDTEADQCQYQDCTNTFPPAHSSSPTRTPQQGRNTATSSSDYHHPALSLLGGLTSIITHPFQARRHHCRACGGVFCSQHSSNTMPLLQPSHPTQILGAPESGGGNQTVGREGGARDTSKTVTPRRRSGASTPAIPSPQGTAVTGGQHGSPAGTRTVPVEEHAASPSSLISQMSSRFSLSSSDQRDATTPSTSLHLRGQVINARVCDLCHLSLSLGANLPNPAMFKKGTSRTKKVTDPTRTSRRSASSSKQYPAPLSAAGAVPPAHQQQKQSPSQNDAGDADSHASSSTSPPDRLTTSHEQSKPSYFPATTRGQSRSSKTSPTSSVPRTDGDEGKPHRCRPRITASSGADEVTSSAEDSSTASRFRQDSSTSTERSVDTQATTPPPAVPSSSTSPAKAYERREEDASQQGKSRLVVDGQAEREEKETVTVTLTPTSGPRPDAKFVDSPPPLSANPVSSGGGSSSSSGSGSGSGSSGGASGIAIVLESQAAGAAAKEQQPAPDAAAGGVQDAAVGGGGDASAPPMSRSSSSSHASDAAASKKPTRADEATLMQAHRRPHGDDADDKGVNLDGAVTHPLDPRHPRVIALEGHPAGGANPESSLGTTVPSTPGAGWTWST